MLAIKIFDDRDPAHTDALLARLNPKKPNFGIEVALYSNKGFTTRHADLLRALPDSTKILHSAGRARGLAELAARDVRALAQQALDTAQGKRLGISRVIVHGNDSVETALHHNSPAYAAKQVLPAIESLLGQGLVPYFENSYEPLPWLKLFFNELIALGLASQMGFCLDIGHVRVWGKDTIDAFYTFAKFLKTAGFRQHFHIHANAGLHDEHMALPLAYTADLLYPSSDWAPTGVMPWLSKALKEYPESLFTLENAQEHAMEALTFTQFVLEA